MGNMRTTILYEVAHFAGGFARAYFLTAASAATFAAGKTMYGGHPAYVRAILIPAGSENLWNAA